MKLEMKVVFNDLPKVPGKARAGIAKGLAAAKGPLLSDLMRRTPVDTGELRASESAESDDRSLTLRATAPHSVYVHQGTRKMAPRPFMRDAVEQGVGRIEDAIAAGIRGELG